MPKYDPSFLPALPLRRESKNFTLKNGEVISLTAQAQDGGDAAYALLDQHKDNLEKWEASGVPQPGLPPIKITSTLCWLITRILLAIVPGPGEEHSDLWQFTHWAVLASRDEKAFGEISSWVGSVIDPKEEEEDSAANPPPASSPASGGDAAAS